MTQPTERAQGGADGMDGLLEVTSHTVRPHNAAWSRVPRAARQMRMFACGSRRCDLVDIAPVMSRAVRRSG
jgi:hypothetical protein